MTDAAWQLILYGTNLKRSFRQVVAVTLVATVLCADHVVCAAPHWQKPAVDLACKLVQRLRVSFKHAVPSLRLYVRRPAGPVRVGRPLALLAQRLVPVISLHPFQFRIPPPRV